MCQVGQSQMTARPRRSRSGGSILHRLNLFWSMPDPVEQLSDLRVEDSLLSPAQRLMERLQQFLPLPEGFQREVLDAHPRLDTVALFGSRVTDQASRKPTTAAERLMADGLMRKLTNNPLEGVSR